MKIISENINKCGYFTRQGLEKCLAKRPTVSWTFDPNFKVVIES